MACNSNGMVARAFANRCNKTQESKPPLKPNMAEATAASEVVMAMAASEAEARMEQMEADAATPAAIIDAAAPALERAPTSEPAPHVLAAPAPALPAQAVPAPAAPAPAVPAQDV